MAHLPSEDRVEAAALGDIICTLLYLVHARWWPGCYLRSSRPKNRGDAMVHHAALWIHEVDKK